MTDVIRTSKTKLDPSALMDNAACASQCSELLDDHPTRQAVLLNVYRPLWDEIEQLQTELKQANSRIAWLEACRPAHETTALPESLRDPAVVMERVRTLHQQTDAALWLLRWLSRKGGLGHDVHKLIDAVLEGRAYVRNDQLHTDGPPSQKAKVFACGGCGHEWTVSVNALGYQCPCGHYTALSEPE